MPVSATTTSARSGDLRNYGLARQHQEQHRSVWRRWLHERQLAAVTRIAFFVSAGAFLAWASPFFPRGLDPDTYAGPAALAAALGSMAVLFWLVSSALSFRAAGRRRVMAPWASLFDEETGIYNRAYFLDTLELEIARGHRTGATLTVYVIEIRSVTPTGGLGRLSAEDADTVIACANRLLGRDDTLATLRPDEFAALVLPPCDWLSPAALLAALSRAIGSSRARRNFRLRIGHARFEPGVGAQAMLDAARAELRTAPTKDTSQP